MNLRNICSLRQTETRVHVILALIRSNVKPTLSEWTTTAATADNRINDLLHVRACVYVHGRMRQSRVHVSIRVINGSIMMRRCYKSDRILKRSASSPVNESQDSPIVMERETSFEILLNGRTITTRELIALVNFSTYETSAPSIHRCRRWRENNKAPMLQRVIV